MRTVKSNFVLGSRLVLPRDLVEEEVKSMFVNYGGYHAGPRGRNSMTNWNPLGNDADADVLPDLQTLRNRSRDLIRNNPVAQSIVYTKANSVIGAGLTFCAELDADDLGLEDDVVTPAPMTLKLTVSLVLV